MGTLGGGGGGGEQLLLPCVYTRQTPHNLQHHWRWTDQCRVGWGGVGCGGLGRGGVRRGGVG